MYMYGKDKKNLICFESFRFGPCQWCFLLMFSLLSFLLLSLLSGSLFPQLLFPIQKVSQIKCKLKFYHYDPHICIWTYNMFWLDIHSLSFPEKILDSGGYVIKAPINSSFIGMNGEINGIIFQMIDFLLYFRLNHFTACYLYVFICLCE